MLLLLLVAVVVPTACVLWFMTEAMRNERLAVRQKLTEAYRDQLTAAQRRLETEWRARTGALANVDPIAPAGETFARLVATGDYTSVLIYDRAGSVRYPFADPAPADDGQLRAGPWLKARQLEHEGDDPAAAAAAYADVAAQTEDINTVASALEAQGRCLVRAGNTQEAIKILAVELADVRYRNATGPLGRFVAPNAQLRALQLMNDPHHAEYRRTVEAMVRRLTDYGEPVLPPSQRRFLMHELRIVVPGCPALPTLAAEDLAADYLESHPAMPGLSYFGPILLRDPWPVTPPPEETPYLRPTRLQYVWQLTSGDRTVVALFSQPQLVARLQQVLTEQVSFTDVTVELVAPGAAPSQGAPLLVADAGTHLPEWQLALHLHGQEPLARAADRQVAAYMWTGLLVIFVVTALALLVARRVTRQMKLTRLKNDLIATVSHELKTPLASMRVLVDTLLEGRYRDQQQVQEYLRLIAMENARLSRMIDNFLSFSRMERNRRAFQFEQVHIQEIVPVALETVGERFAPPHCRFETEVADNLPAVFGDRDALTTVVLNLLDNAHKYTEDEKHITLRAYAADGHVCVEVQDNGIGLSRRTMKRVFDRFYHFDQTLSRRAGGCGLGLSIVKFIVDAHGGSIDVASQPGKGSTFTVRLPVHQGEERGSRQPPRSSPE